MAAAATRRSQMPSPLLVQLLLLNACAALQLTTAMTGANLAYSFGPSTTPGPPIFSARSCLRSTSPIMSASSLAALLFDCDGVLADTERDGHRVSFNQAFHEKGFDFEWAVDEYGRLCETGGGKERMTAYFNVHGWPVGFESPTTEELVKGLPVDPDRLELVKGLHQRKTNIFMDLIRTGVVPLRPGVLRLVDEAMAANVPVAVCSTSNEAAVRALVETLMGEERYAAFGFFCGDAVPKKKPAPDVYLLAAETLGVEPSACVVVEDSGIGNKAAKAAGMACLVTTSTYTINEDFTGADAIVPALGEPGDDDCVTLADLEALLEDAKAKSAA